jgi:hypothetical protein
LKFPLLIDGNLVGAKIRNEEYTGETRIGALTYDTTRLCRDRMIKPTSKHRVGAIDLNRFETTTPIPIVARIATLALGAVRNIVWESDNLKLGPHEKSTSQRAFWPPIRLEYLKLTAIARLTIATQAADPLVGSNIDNAIAWEDLIQT